MNFVRCRIFKMPSYSQEINVDLNTEENSALNNESKDSSNGDNLSQIKQASPSNDLNGLNSDQQLSFALRDFLGSANMAIGSDEPSPSNLGDALSYIDEHIDAEHSTQSEDEQVQRRDTEEVLNNAACRLRRWRAASRKLRRPRIIDNLCTNEEKDGNAGKICNGGHTDLADRLRSLAAAGSMSASAGELLSLAPPPPAATAPSSPGCLLSPSLAEQSSAEYFVSFLIFK